MACRRYWLIMVSGLLAVSGLPLSLLVPAAPAQAAPVEIASVQASPQVEAQSDTTVPDTTVPPTSAPPTTNPESTSTTTPESTSTTASASARQSLTSTAVDAATIAVTETIGATTTVTGGSSTDPTGTVTFYFCYSAETAPTTCSSTTGTKISDVALSDDVTDDGSATAALSNWSPANKIGFYRIHAVYGGDANFDASSDTGTTVDVAVDSVGPCADPSADPFAGGKGTLLEPYQVATAEQLRALSLTATYDTCMFRQTADISLAAYARWVPIGSTSPYFRGVYDGGGYVISGLAVSGVNIGGLFRTLSNNGVTTYTPTIRNVRLSGTVSARSYAGGLVGLTRGAVDIIDVHVDVDVTGGSYVGGLVGNADEIRLIEQSSALGDVVGSGDTIGGLVGTVYGPGTIRDSYARGSVRGSSYVAGFAGGIGGTTNIVNSYSTGPVLSGTGNGFAGSGTRAVTATFWDMTSSGRSTSYSTAVGKTTLEMQTLSTFGAWSIATTWSPANTWVLCAGLNGGYPALTAHYTNDPCVSGTLTVTASSMAIGDDVAAPAVPFTSSRGLLPGDFDTAPTCEILDDSAQTVSGVLTAGTYTSRCRDAAYSLASRIDYVDGSVTVRSPAGGRLAMARGGMSSADIVLAGTDGSNQRVLVTSSLDSPELQWSPDGQKLAYLSSNGSNVRVHVTDRNGSTPTVLDGPAFVSATEFVWLDDQTVLAWFPNSGMYTLPLSGSATATTGAPTAATDRALRHLTINAERTALAYVYSVATYTQMCGSMGCSQVWSGTNDFMYKAPVSGGQIGTPVQMSTISAAVEHPAFSADGASLLYVTNGKSMTAMDLSTGTTSTVVTAGARYIQQLAVDPVSGDVFFQQCADMVCVLPDLYRAPVTAGATPALVAAGMGNPAPGSARESTSTTTAVASAAIVTGSTISATTTVTAASGADDPTGTLTYYYCYDATTAPTACSAATGTQIGDPVSLDGGSAGDGTASASLSAWTPASGTGYYRFAAAYSGVGEYASSEESGTAVSVGVDDRLVCADSSADPFDGGSGTLLDPYRIATAAQLAAISATYADCSFLQTADISLGGYRNWTPIGSWGSPHFQGFYDGGGHSITGLRVAAGANSGLFAAITKGSYQTGVTDLYVVGRVSGSSNTGGLVGHVSGEVSISGVHVDVDVISTDHPSGGLVGGITGPDAEIGRSSAMGDVTGVMRVGGLVGSVSDATISYSFARGAVTASSGYSGGLIGKTSAATLTSVYATGRVSSTTDSSGLVGEPDSNTTVTGGLWDSETTEQATGLLGTGLTTAEMTDPQTFVGLGGVSAGWVQPFTTEWITCSGLNDEYPVQQSRYTSDPCNGAVTVTAETLTIAEDFTIPPMGYTTSPTFLPSEWATAPTCSAYDGSDTVVTGMVTSGTYAVRCAGGVLDSGATVLYSPGTLTVTDVAATGGRAVAALISSDHAYIVTMLPDGTQMRRVRETTTTTPRPQISPEGDKIAFIDTAADGSLEAFAMKIDGTNVVQMTDGTDVPETLAWADNSVLLVDKVGGGMLRVSTPRSPTTLTAPVFAVDTIAVNYDGTSAVYSRTESANLNGYSGATVGATSITGGSRLPNSSTSGVTYPTYHPNRTSILYVQSGNQIVSRTGSTNTIVLTETGKEIRWIDADPVSGKVFFELCDTSPCGTVGSIYSAPIELNATKTLVLANATSPSISYAADRLVPTVSVAPATATSVKSQNVSVTATVTAPAGSTTDPTGPVTFYTCFSTTALPMSCEPGDLNREKAGEVTLVAGTENDGVATASLNVFGNVVGWYYVVAMYRGDVVYTAGTKNTSIIYDDRSACADPAVDPFAGGKGSKFDPYQIATANQLAAITRTYEQCAFKQTADISLAGYRRWTPIGSWGSPYFRGSYDGGGFSIVDMHVDVASNGGLFAGIGKTSNFDATIKNLYVSGTVTGGDNVGGLAGSAGAFGEVVTITNVHVDVDVTSTGSHAGGLVGSLANSTITGSSAIGDVTATTTGKVNAGGLVGYTVSSTINDSFARGSVAGVSYVGGLVGRNSSLQLARSYSTGAVSGTTSVGGLSGASATGATSYWDTTTSGQASSVAGTGATTDEMKTAATYNTWSIATSWSSPMTATWLMCAGVNDGYPVHSARFSADPCSSSAVTVTAASVATSVDRGASGPISFVSSPVTLPSEWTTLPTCAIYDDGDTVRSGALPEGTYTVRCSGGSLARASSVAYRAGTLTVGPAGVGGRMVAALSSGNAAYVVTMKTDGTGLRRVRATSTGAPRPALSPNGEKIAFIDTAPDGSLQVFLMDLEGTGVVQMTNGAQIPEGLAWVDDSVLLIDQVGGKLLRLAARNDPKELASSSSTIDFVQVDPLGTAIVYRDLSSGSYGLYRADLTSSDISGATLLTSFGGSTLFSATWSSDGTKILYTKFGTQIVSRAVAGGTETTVLTEAEINLATGTARPVIGSMAVDRVSGELFYNVCLRESACLAPRVRRTTISGTITPSTLADGVGGSVSITSTPRMVPTLSTTADDTTVLIDASVAITTTVTGPEGHGDVDPTGKLTHYYCYSRDVAPQSCSSTTGTLLVAEATLADDGSGDGTVSEMIASWTPPDGTGYYRIHAEYTGDTAYRPVNDPATDIVVAVDSRDVCADPSTDPFAGGTGTALDPYLVADAADLAAITGEHLDCAFRQTADISLSAYERWTPIGYGSQQFTGSYDGDGHAITGLRVVGASPAGLFGTAGDGLVEQVVIRDLLVSGSVSGGAQSGGLVGQTLGPITVSDVHVDVDVTSAVGSDVGGLIGFAKDTAITQSSASGTVSTAGRRVGGLVGRASGSTIDDSFARGPVTGSGEVGGFVGRADTTAIANSYATGAVDASGDPDLGGFIGSASGGSIDASYSDADATPSSTSSYGVAKATADLVQISTYIGWDISATWSTASTWLICEDLNDGYPVTRARFADDPCNGLGAVTITPNSMVLTSDVPAPAVTFGSSPATLPSDWQTEPTCAIHNEYDQVVSGLLEPGTYSTRCVGAAWDLAGSIVTEQGTVVVTAAASGGPLLSSMPYLGIADIMISRPDGTGIRRVATVNTTDPRPVWSPTGDQIAYIDVVDGRRQVFTMTRDGARVEQWTFGSSNPEPLSVAWLNVAAIAVATGDTGLWIATMQGEYKPMVDSPATANGVAVSRDGQHLAIVGRAVSSMQDDRLYIGEVMNDRVMMLQERAPGLTAGAPAFTGDASNVVFAVGRAVIALDIASGNVRSVYESPQGTAVAAIEVDPHDESVIFEQCVTSACDGAVDLYTIPLDGIGTATQVLAATEAPSLATARTTTESDVSTSTITYGGDVDVTITVTNRSNFDTALAPTGTVSLYYCYSALAAPWRCDTSSGTLASAVLLTAGATGVATATVTDWAPAQGAGFYRFHAVYTGDDSLFTSTEVGSDIALEVGKASLTVTPDGHDLTYGDAIPTYSFGLAPFVGADTASGLSGYTPPVCTSSYSPATPVTDAPLTVTCSGGSSDNYTFLTSATAQVTIAAKELTVEPDATEVVYGADEPDYTATVNGFVNGDGTSSTGYVDPVCDAEYDVDTPVSESPTISCSGGSFTNYTFDTSATGVLDVVPATLTVTPDARRVVYGASEPTTYTFAVNGFRNGETTSSASGYRAPVCDSLYQAGTPRSASPVTITCTGGAADNYLFETAPAGVVIRAAVLKVTPTEVNVTYGDPEPTYPITVTGFVNGETEKSGGYTAPSCDSSYTAATPVALSPTISCTGGSFVNYTFDRTATAKVIVGRAELVVTPPSPAVEYGAPTPELIAMIEGFVNGDEEADLATLPECTTTRSTVSPVSTYDVTCTADPVANYRFDVSEKGTLTVDQAELKVVPADQRLVYGAAVPTYGFNLFGFADGESIAVLDRRPTCTSNYTTSTPVSASGLTITCTPGEDTNYSFDVSTTASVTISRKQLTVTPDPKSVAYGDVVPTHTFSVTGFANGENPGTATGYTAPNCSSSYSPTMEVSSPPLRISCRGGSAANYSFDTTGTSAVTISRKQLTVTPDATALTYGDATPAHTFSVTGFANGETAGTAAGYVAPTCSSSYAATTHVSSSPLAISCSGGSAANYSFDTSGTASVTISKKQLTVTPAATSVTYGDAAPSYTFSMTGFVNGETATVIATAPRCSSAYTPSTPVSSSPMSIGCTGGDDEDYSFDLSATASLTIASAAAPVTATFPSTLAATEPIRSLSVSLAGGPAAFRTASVVPACAVGRRVTFTVTPAPVPAGPFEVTSDSAGAAATPTIRFLPGTRYTVAVSVAATGDCSAQTLSGSISTFGLPGRSSRANGRYQVPSASPGGKSVSATVGVNVTSTSSTSRATGDRATVYTGPLKWEVPRQWRLKATVSSRRVVSRTGEFVGGYAGFVTIGCPTPATGIGTVAAAPVCGVLTGSGNLERWDPTALGGRGGWVLSTHGRVDVTASVNDGGTRRSCPTGPRPKCATVIQPDSFGLLLSKQGVVLDGVITPTNPVTLTGSVTNAG